MSNLRFAGDSRRDYNDACAKRRIYDSYCCGSGRNAYSCTEVALPSGTIACTAGTVEPRISTAVSSMATIGQATEIGALCVSTAELATITVSSVLKTAEPLMATVTYPTDAVAHLAAAISTR